jgi:hypothetical protein
MNNNYYTIEPTQELQGSAYSLWQPGAATNRKIIVDTGINSNWNYRKYIQKNANDIMKYNTMQAINTSGNNPYTVLNTNTVNNTPHLYSSIHDTNNPPHGYRASDLRKDFLTKQQIKARMISPSIPTNF